MDNYYFSMKYEDSLTPSDKKSRGIYYTPKSIVRYILEETISKHNIIENPEPRIIDLSCGCGNFLLESFDILYEMIAENIDEIKRIHGSDYIDNISTHIIENCIYGIDIDNEAINILKRTLINDKLNVDNNKKTINSINTNIICADALKTDYSIKFDYIIGNPPYVGHKILGKGNKKYLLEEYKEVYRDKADLYFCFYKRALDLLKDNGKIGYITPRYFIESPSGKYLRDYLFKESKIHKIIDLREAKVFNKIGISPVIVLFSLKQNDKSNIIQIYKNSNKNINVKNTDTLNTILQSKYFEKISIKQEDLKDKWIIVNREDKNFYNKIEGRCQYTLEDIAISFQGIITGCDKAFVLHNNDKRISHISKDILKIWIKNKNVCPYIIEESNYKLIYSNDIKNLENYKYIEDSCFVPYKEKLENRRECRQNIRKWYELQWGRDKALFEQIKIMYPYKSTCNKFAIDYNNSFSSADVYSFFIKKEYEKNFSYEYIIGILNSSIYDRYFKINAKNMGKGIYDYYPNKVMKLKIFKDENYEEIESLSKKIISNKVKQQKYKKEYNLQDKEIALNKEIYYLENESHFLENRISKLIIKSLNL